MLLINIRREGKGSIIATGNTAPYNMGNFYSTTLKTFRGKIVVIVQPDGEKVQYNSLHLLKE